MEGVTRQRVYITALGASKKGQTAGAAPGGGCLGFGGGPGLVGDGAECHGA